MMRLILMLVVAVSMTALVSCGGASNPSAEEADQPADDAEMGEMLFQGQVKADVNCASCHDAESGQAPDLATLVTGLSDEEILKAMEEGKGAMPGFSEMLMEKEQQQILSCLRARFDSTEEAPAETEEEPATEEEPNSDEPSE